MHHPILDARHWGIIDGKDIATPAYHHTHSCYAVAAFHEALRIILGYGRRRKASDYAYHEKALRQAVEAMGCDVTSNMTSLVVLNLPGKLKGKEKELVAGCRRARLRHLADAVGAGSGAHRHSQPADAGSRSPRSLSRFADAMLAMGAEFDKAEGDERAQVLLCQSRVERAHISRKAGGGGP